jgi:Flp pilus assembly protein TadD
VERVLQLQNLLALLGLLGLAGLGLWLRNRRPIIAFGIFWFFLSLLVESSVIPLDPVFEHRLYLAMFGFALVLVDLFGLPSRPRLAICGLAVVVTVFGFLTWQRNSLWNDPVAFYEDNLARYPKGERTMSLLAGSYAARGDKAKAEALYRQVLQTNPRYDALYHNFGKLLIEQGRWAEAAAVLDQGLRLFPQNAELYVDLGIVLSQRGDKARAEEAFQRAISLSPTTAEAYANLGILYMERGQSEMTEQLNRQILSFFPEHGQAHYNLGVVYFYRKDFRAARDAFELAHRNGYNESYSLYNLALAELRLGNRSAVLAILPRLAALDPGLGAQMQARMAEVTGGGRASE